MIAAAPEPITVRRYRCPFCHRSRSSRSATAEHIARCWLNPAVQSCKTCAHLWLYPGGDPCFPGRPCNCNDADVDCAAGVALDFDSMPVTSCPLWALKER